MTKLIKSWWFSHFLSEAEYFWGLCKLQFQLKLKVELYLKVKLKLKVELYLKVALNLKIKLKLKVALYLNLTLKYSSRRTFHDHGRFGLFVPGALDVAAENVYGNFRVCKTVKYACNSGSAASCSTGKCLACSAFPDSHVYVVLVIYLYELSVCAVREH